MAAPATGKRGLKASVGAVAAALLLSYVPQFEGMVLRGYKDPVGIVTACAGHTKTAVLGRAYTPEQCNVILEDDLVEHAEGVKACIKVPASTGEIAAYTSFAFNVGTGAFCRSTMVRKLNAGDHAGACAELSKWIYAGDRQLPGLVKRRAAERAICEGKTQ
jgi:lysozyme